jgi:tRNA(Ile)-lysidine synthase
VKFSVRGAVPEVLSSAISRAESAALFNKIFQLDDRILVAVSGGPDSMALLALLAEWRPDSIFAATVDHGLRPGSRAEALAVAEFCGHIGVAHNILDWETPKPRSGLQQAARSARYALLCDCVRSRDLTCLVTAHHADDQAETLLMRMTSGSGIAGLAGMRIETPRHESLVQPEGARPVRHLRPLLGLSNFAISKQRLVDTCVQRSIPFVSDASNGDLRFERARVRRIMGLLEGEGLTVDRLVRLAARAASADDALMITAVEAFERLRIVFKDDSAQMQWSALSGLAPEIRLRVVLKVLQQLSKGRFVEKRERLEALVCDLDMAYATASRLRRSLGHWIVTMRVNGETILTPAPPRQRGNQPIRHET